ncbi:MAG: hypothetical protein WD426_19420 [Anditalea sp.]
MEDKRIKSYYAAPYIHPVNKNNIPSEQERIIAMISMAWGKKYPINTGTGKLSSATEQAYPNMAPL